jgi:hypothetical protein
MVEKSPRNVPHIEKLRVVSPNCRMLFIHRHPVDVLASYRARARRDPAASWADVSVSRFVRVYRQGVLGAYERATCEPDLRIVSYEQFTHDPVEEFRSICDFLGEPSDTRAVTEPPARSEPRPDRLLEGAVLVNRRRWEEDVDPGTARRLERDLADVMDRAGYQPYT